MHDFPLTILTMVLTICVYLFVQYQMRRE